MPKPRDLLLRELLTGASVRADSFGDFYYSHRNSLQIAILKLRERGYGIVTETHYRLIYKPEDFK